MTVAPPNVPRARFGFVKSGNWGGYTNMGGSNVYFNDAISYWKVPRYSCHVRVIGKRGSQAGQWVGIDGGPGTSTVEQEGTSVNCVWNRRHTRLTPITTVWWEMFPKPPVPYVGAVHSGDVMGAETKYVGNGDFALFIKDFTNGKYLDTTQPCESNCALHTAEDISEFPGAGVKAKLTFTKMSSFPFYGYYNSIYYATTNQDLYGYFGTTAYWQTRGSIIFDPVLRPHRTMGTVSAPLDQGRAFWFYWKHAY